MCERKAWTKQEDQLLTKLMAAEGTANVKRKLKWNQIAAKISELSPSRIRKGKQCRERWFNQLHPDINREAEWTPEEQRLLFTLQGTLGNRWARIAREIPGRSDNNIKNYFYSTLRKALRGVNNYVTSQKQRPCYKNIKAFQSNTLNKILTVAENKADRKVILGKQNATQLAKDIRDALIQLQINKLQESLPENDVLMEELVAKIQDFNRICKRRKTKKKEEEQSSGNNHEEDSYSMVKEDSADASLTPTHHKSFARNQFHSLKAVEAHPCGKKPLRSGQAGVEERQALGLKQVQSQPIVQRKASFQPIIPALQTSNCFSLPTEKTLSFQQKQKEPQALNSLKQPPLTYPDSLPTTGLNFIPMLQTNYYSGSAFMPTSFFPPRPFLGLEPNPNHPAFSLNWSQQFKLKSSQVVSGFGRMGQNGLQQGGQGEAGDDSK